VKRTIHQLAYFSRQPGSIKKINSLLIQIECKKQIKNACVNIGLFDKELVELNEKQGSSYL
jgi:hypothetical protein